MQIPLAGVVRVRRLRRRVLAVAALLCGFALIVGCGKSEPTGTPSSSPALSVPAPTSAGTDPVRNAADGALAAYRGMWSAYEKAARAANPDEPAMGAYATGAALTTLTSGVKSIKDRGLVLKGQFVLDPTVTGFTPADAPKSVEIKDCADDSNALLYRTSGELYNDQPGGRRSILATAEDIGGGTWKVTSFGVKDVGTC